MTTAEFVDALKRHPLRVTATAVAVLSGLGVYFVNDYIETSTHALSQKVAEGDRLAANVKYSAQLPEQYDALVEASKTIQDRAVRASQLATNLQYFYRLESETGVELLELRQTTAGTAQRPGKGSVSGVGFSVAVKGDYPTVLNWLRRLEASPHYCRILSANITPAGADRAGPVSLAVSLELFGQP